MLLRAGGRLYSYLMAGETTLDAQGKSKKSWKIPYVHPPAATPRFVFLFLRLSVCVCVWPYRNFHTILYTINQKVRRTPIRVLSHPKV